MARRLEENPTAHTLEEIEHFGDRVVEAVARNPLPVLLVLGGILLAAGAWSGVSYYRSSRAERAVAALEEVRTGYVRAMGGTPTSFVIPEPANPETARKIRQDYAERFEAMAEQHAGTPSAALGLVEAGQLRAQLGEPDAALELWRRAAAGADGPLRGLILVRIAQADEDAGRIAEAAQGYAQAGDIADYPLRYEALGDAARAWAAAGDPDRAVALFKRIQAESPDTQLPPYEAARLRELEAAQR